MECKKCHSQLSDYLEGKLNMQKMQAMAAHLNVCSDCHSFASFLKSTFDIIQEEKQIQPDAFMYSRIMAGIVSIPARGKVKNNFLTLRWITAVAAGLVLLIGVFGGLGLGRVLTPSEQPDESELSGFAYLINDLETEPIENFLLEL